MRATLKLGMRAGGAFAVVLAAVAVMAFGAASATAGGRIIAAPPKPSQQPINPVPAQGSGSAPAPGPASAPVPDPIPSPESYTGGSVSVFRHGQGTYENQQRVDRSDLNDTMPGQRWPGNLADPWNSSNPYPGSLQNWTSEACGQSAGCLVEWHDWYQGRLDEIGTDPRFADQAAALRQEMGFVDARIRTLTGNHDPSKPAVTPNMPLGPEPQSSDLPPDLDFPTPTEAGRDVVEGVVDGLMDLLGIDPSSVTADLCKNYTVGDKPPYCKV